MLCSKEILLFQSWLKLLCPAESPICYSDGIACRTKQRQEAEILYPGAERGLSAEMGDRTDVFVYGIRELGEHETFLFLSMRSKSW